MLATSSHPVIKNNLINYPVEIKILKEPSYNGDTAKHENKKVSGHMSTCLLKFLRV